MENSVKISVVMGVYNPHPRRLAEAVDSLLQQSFRDWELLLFDDGSTYFSAAVRRTAEKDPRIRCFRGEQNRGLAYALNRCLALAKGDYIARMDDDDIARADRLGKQYAFLEAHPSYQWVGSNAALFDDGGVWGMLQVPERPRREDFLSNSPYIHPSVLFRKTALVQIGGYSLAPRHRQLEDYELFMRLHRNGLRGYNLQEPLLQYREDAAAYAKRGYRRRIREARLRLEGFRKLGLLRPSTLPYAVKPLAVGALPVPLYQWIRRRNHLPERRERP